MPAPFAPASLQVSGAAVYIEPATLIQNNSGSPLTSGPYTLLVQAPLIDYIDITLHWNVRIFGLGVGLYADAAGVTPLTALTLPAQAAGAAPLLAVTKNTVDTVLATQPGLARLTMQGRATAADASLPAVMQACTPTEVAEFYVRSINPLTTYPLWGSAVVSYAGSAYEIAPFFLPKLIQTVS